MRARPPPGDLTRLALGFIAALALVSALTAAKWPSTSGTTADGVVIEDGAGNKAGTTVSATPTAGTTSTVATGGTAVTLITGPISGGYIVNPPNATAQGIGAAESVYIDIVGTPGSTEAANNGTTSSLPATGGVFTLPALASGVLVKANAATTGHKLAVVKW